MRLIASLGLLVLAGCFGWLWLSGAFDALASDALAAQRAMTAALAQGLAAIRAGEPGAVAALMLAAGTYGLAHAAGPGHGKALLGAAAAGTRTGPARLVALAVGGALAQGLSAALVVGVGLGILRLGMTTLVSEADRFLAGVGLWMLAGIGAWLMWRGLGASRRMGCCDGHGPARVGDRIDGRAAAALIAGIAARPCGGAMLVLAVAWSAGLAWAGALAVLAMALGTAVVTSASALAAFGARQATLVAGGASRLAPVAAGLQIAAGLGALGIAAAGLAG